MTKQHFEDYLLVLDSKMEHCGFVKFHQEPHDLQAEKSFRRRKFSITKFGVVDTFCVVKCLAENLTTNFLESFSKQVFEFALKNKICLPRGWGGQQLLTHCW